MATPALFKNVLLGLAFPVLASGLIVGLVQLRAGQLGPEKRARESKLLAIARALPFFEDLDALEAAKILPEGGEILTGEGTHSGSVETQWNRLPPAEKAKAQEGYRALQALPLGMQAELMDRYDRFESFSPEKQRRLLHGMAALEQLSPEARETRLKEWRSQRNL